MTRGSTRTRGHSPWVLISRMSYRSSLILRNVFLSVVVQVGGQVGEWVGVGWAGVAAWAREAHYRGIRTFADAQGHGLPPGAGSAELVLAVLLGPFLDLRGWVDRLWVSRVGLKKKAWCPRNDPHVYMYIYEAKTQQAQALTHANKVGSRK